MSAKYVPLSMGSVRASTLDVGAFTVTEVSFPPLSTLLSHRHERAIFAVILDGAFEDRFDRGPCLECPPGSVVTEPAGAPHANRFERQGTRLLVLQPHPEKTELFRPCAPFLDQINHFRHPGITGMAWRLASELRHPDGVSSLAIEGLGLEMLATAARAYQPRPAAPPAWLLRVEALLHDCFLEGLALDEIARVADVHPVHLARVFRAHYRDSIGAYIRKLRLDWATTQLAVSTEPIAQIALRAGFADQSHFTRAFKQHTGLPPSQYRKTVGQA